MGKRQPGRLNGRTVLVTGATSGIGAAAAGAMAQLGAQLIVHGPDSAAAGRACQHLGGAGEPVWADFRSLDEVRRLAGEIAERYPTLDVLVNNAAATFPRYQLNGSGVELTLAVNHLAPYLLTRMLLPILEQSGRGRIIVVASEAHRKALLDIGDGESPGRYRRFGAYAQSKLANLLFAYELARRLDGRQVTVNAVHPGTSRTGLFPPRNVVERIVMPVLDRRAASPDEGADTIVWLASSPELDGSSGGYYVGRRPLVSSSESHDAALAQRLWEWSAERTGLPD